MNPVQSKAELIREKFKKHELVKGAHVFYNDPAITETFGYMGFDYVWVDGEHCAFDKQALLNHVVGAYAGGTASIVRVEWNDPVLIKPVLEMGPDGIILPMVCTAEEAQKAVEACMYPISCRGNQTVTGEGGYTYNGVRGFGPRRANQYGAISNEEYLKDAHKSFLRIVQIEHKTAVENLREIISTPGLDAIVVGPNDLSASYGYLGDVHNPAMQPVYEAIDAICKEKDFPFGVSIGPDHAFIEEWIRRGVSLISCADDISSVNLESRDVLGFISTLE